MGYMEDQEQMQSSSDGQGSTGESQAMQQDMQVHGVVNLTERTINLVPGSNRVDWQREY